MTNAMKVKLAVLAFFLIFSNLQAQPTNCLSILNQAKGLFNEGNLSESLTKLYDVEICDYTGSLSKERESLRKKILEALSQIDNDGVFWVSQNGTYALIDKTGKRLTEFEFIEVGSFKMSRTIVQKENDGKYYIIDKKGSVSKEGYNYIMRTNNEFYKVRKGSQVAFFNLQFERKTKWYDEILDFFDGYAPFKENGKWGWMSSKNFQEVVPAKIDEIIFPKYDTLFTSYFINKQIFLRVDSSYAVLTSDGKLLYIPGANVSPLNCIGFLLVLQKGKWGVATEDGKYVINPGFDFLIPDILFPCTLIAKKDSLYSLLNLKGPPIFEGVFGNLGFFRWRGSYFQVNIDNKWGVINTINNNYLINPYYDNIGPLKDGHSIVSKDGKCGLIDTLGNLIVNTHYDALSIDENGLIKAYSNGQWCLLNKQGDPIKDTCFDLIESFNKNGVAVTHKNGKRGLIDSKGGEIFSPQFDMIWQLKDNITWVEKAGKWGLVSTKGNFIVPVEIDFIESFGNPSNLITEGFSIVKDKNKYGYIDTTGKYIAQAKFDKAYIFNDGLAIVVVGNKYGWINKKGEYFIKPSYEAVLSFKNGLAPVMINRKWGYINLKGELVIEPIYDWVDLFYEDVALVKQRGHFGIINKDGKVLAKPKFEYIQQPFKNGFAILVKNNEFFKVDKRGLVIVE